MSEKVNAVYIECTVYRNDDSGQKPAFQLGLTLPDWPNLTRVSVTVAPGQGGSRRYPAAEEAG
jgi:hypothetical protein